MANGVICPSVCNNAYRRAKAQYAAAVACYQEALGSSGPAPDQVQAPPVPPEITPVFGDPVFCGRCTALTRRELYELDDLAGRVAAEAEGMRGSHSADSPKVSGSRHSPSPSPLIDALDEMESVFRSWEDDFRGQQQVSSRRGYLTSALTATLDYHIAHFTQNIAHPSFARDYGQDIRNWHRKLKNMGRAGVVRHQMKKPCPRCDRYSLVWEEGSDYVVCQRTGECGRILAYDEYRAYEQMHPYLAAARAAAEKTGAGT